jgi:hypothetical protein
MISLINHVIVNHQKHTRTNNFDGHIRYTPGRIYACQPRQANSAHSRQRGKSPCTNFKGLLLEFLLEWRSGIRLGSLYPRAGVHQALGPPEL